MTRKVLLACLLGLSLGTPALPQQPRPQDRRPTPRKTSQQPAQQDDDDVVRITTNLVQLDAVVLDKDGRHVTDLRPEDFEILQDGRSQPITNFSYIDTTTHAAPSNTAARADAPRGKDAKRTSKWIAPPVAPNVLPRGEARRVIVLAFDDLGLSFETLALARRAGRKFIEEELQPGDLMAVVRTGTGAGALQQLTTDKRQLLAAVDALRWNSRGRGGISPIVSNQVDEATAVDQARSGGFRGKTASRNTLSGLEHFVEGLGELPGRKSIVLITDGFSVGDREEQVRTGEEMSRLVDLANRLSVTFYGIDARGLQTLGIEAAEPGLTIGSPLLLGTVGTLGAVLSGNDPRIGPRRSAFFHSQDGLVRLTRDTGGFALLNRNDILRSLKHVMDDHAGYYLLGYRPDEKTFDVKNGMLSFRSLKINVRRPGLQVRSRSGFYGAPDGERTDPGARTREEQLVDAVSSPFTSGGVGLRLTALFGNEASEGSFIRALLHIDTRDLTFKPEADGWQRADIDVLAVLFYADGTIAGQQNRTHTLRARGDSFDRVLKTGIIYPMKVPVRGAGAFQIRFAVRDAATERIGSANEFVEVPDIQKDKRLAVSSLVAAGYDPLSAGTQGAPPTAEASELNPELSPAIRRFRSGIRMDFGYVIYNARIDKATRRPSLTTQVRLFRDGKQVFASEPEAFDPAAQVDLKRLTARGRLRLGGDLTPGEYQLQIIVTDALAPEREQTVTQWTDFEIIG